MNAYVVLSGEQQGVARDQSAGGGLASLGATAAVCSPLPVPPGLACSAASGLGRLERTVGGGHGRQAELPFGDDERLEGDSNLAAGSERLPVGILQSIGGGTRSGS